MAEVVGVTEEALEAALRGDGADGFEWDDETLAATAKVARLGDGSVEFWRWVSCHRSAGIETLTVVAVTASYLYAKSQQGPLASRALSSGSRLVSTGTERQRVLHEVSQGLKRRAGSTRRLEEERVKGLLTRVLEHAAVTETFVRLGRDGWNGTLEELVRTSVILGTGE